MSRVQHDELVAARARAIAAGPAHASPWHASTHAPDPEPTTLRPPPSLAKRNGNRKKAAPQWDAEHAKRIETRAALVGRTLETSSGPLTLTEEQVMAMSDDEATAVLASAEAQDAAKARESGGPGPGDEGD